LAEALDKFIKVYEDYSNEELDNSIEDEVQTKAKHEEYLKLRPELSKIAESKGMLEIFNSIFLEDGDVNRDIYKENSDRFKELGPDFYTKITRLYKKLRRTERKSKNASSDLVRAKGFKELGANGLLKNIMAYFKKYPKIYKIDKLIKQEYYFFNSLSYGVNNLDDSSIYTPAGLRYRERTNLHNAFVEFAKQSKEDEEIKGELIAEPGDSYDDTGMESPSINDKEEFSSKEESSPINDLDSTSKEDIGTSAINPDSTEKSESADDSMISTSDISMEPEVSSDIETNIEETGSNSEVINNSESTSNEAVYNTDIINSSLPGEILTDAIPNQIDKSSPSINNTSNLINEGSNQEVTSNLINEGSNQDTKISNEYNSTQSSENSLGGSTLNISDNMSSNKAEVANSTSNVSETINSNSLNNVLDSSSASNDKTTSETSLTEVSKNDVNVNKEVFPMNIDNTKTSTSSSNTTLDSNKNTPEIASSISENNTNNNTSVNNKTDESGKKDETPMGVNIDMGEVVSRLGRIEYLLNSTLDVRIKS
tara:strand:+ start:247 stop:1863 length:1617 start_codon:yes stop_codon:yes gene_type:complete